MSRPFTFKCPYCMSLLRRTVLLFGGKHMVAWTCACSSDSRKAAGTAAEVKKEFHADDIQSFGVGA